jgi:hypothetical protein
MSFKNDEQAEQLIEALLLLTGESKLKWVLEEEKCYTCCPDSESEKTKLFLFQNGRFDDDDAFSLKINNFATGYGLLWLLIRQKDNPLDRLLNQIKWHNKVRPKIACHNKFAFNTCNFLTATLLRDHPEVAASLEKIAALKDWKQFSNELPEHDLTYSFQSAEVLINRIEDADVYIIVSESIYRKIPTYNVSLVAGNKGTLDAVRSDFSYLISKDRDKYRNSCKVNILTFSIAKTLTQNLFATFDTLYHEYLKVISLRTILDRQTPYFEVIPISISEKMQEIAGKKAYSQKISQLEANIRLLRENDKTVFKWMESLPKG